MRPDGSTADLRIFCLRRKDGSVAHASHNFRRELARALPRETYWHDEVLNGGSYPPHPTATPPRTCRRRGDRGRFYPAYYVSGSGDRACCYDCRLHQLHAERVQWAREEAGIESDGRAISDREALEELEELEPQEQSMSPSGQAFKALAERGIVLEECKLEAEDLPTIMAQISRYLNAVGTRHGRPIKL